MQQQEKIDLNADLGEDPNADLDRQIIPFLSSCNIACGGHVGNEETIRRTVLLAKKQGVKIGAHPSYPDREHFGRQEMDISVDTLQNSLSEQINSVKIICEELDVTFHHVKPHGALYNKAATSSKISQMLVNIIREVVPEAYWMGLAQSTSQRVAKELNQPFIAEGFADRRYLASGQLMSRREAGAVLDKLSAIQQAEEITLRQRVFTDTGWIPLRVQSLCLHGDTEGATLLAKKIRKHLESRGVQIATV